MDWGAAAALPLLALVLANLPFLTEQILLVRQPHDGRKTAGWRLLNSYCSIARLAWRRG